jgi:cytochrome P450
LKKLTYKAQSEAQPYNPAGTDTTANFSEWMLAYLLHYPEWQAKIHKELSDLTGNNSFKVTLNEKEDAHLTNAFIEEVKRS